MKDKFVTRFALMKNYFIQMLDNHHKFDSLNDYIAFVAAYALEYNFDNLISLKTQKELHMFTDEVSDTLYIITTKSGHVYYLLKDNIVPDHYGDSNHSVLNLIYKERGYHEQFDLLYKLAIRIVNEMNEINYNQSKHHVVDQDNLEKKLDDLVIKERKNKSRLM